MFQVALEGNSQCTDDGKHEHERRAANQHKWQRQEPEKNMSGAGRRARLRVTRNVANGHRSPDPGNKQCCHYCWSHVGCVVCDHLVSIHPNSMATRNVVGPARIKVSVPQLLKSICAPDILVAA